MSTLFRLRLDNNTNITLTQGKFKSRHSFVLLSSKRRRNNVDIFKCADIVNRKFSKFLVLCVCVFRAQSIHRDYAWILSTTGKYNSLERSRCAVYLYSQWFRLVSGKFRCLFILYTARLFFIVKWSATLIEHHPFFLVSPYFFPYFYCLSHNYSFRINEKTFFFISTQNCVFFFFRFSLHTFAKLQFKIILFLHHGIQPKFFRNELKKKTKKKKKLFVTFLRLTDFTPFFTFTYRYPTL